MPGSPSVAWTSGSLVITAFGDDGNLNYWWQPTDSGTWHLEQVASVSSTGPVFAAPAIAWTGSSVVIAATDSNNNLDYWWQPVAGTTWHPGQVAAGSPDSSWALRLSPGRAVPWSSPPPTATATWTTGGSRPTAAPGTPNGSHSPAPTPALSWWAGDPAIAWTGRSVVITAVVGGTRVGLDYWWQQADSGTWHPERVAAGAPDSWPWAWVTGRPAIAWTGSSVVIAATDTNGNLNYWFQPASSGTWYREQVAAGSAAKAFNRPAIAWTGSSVVITATNNDGNLYYWWQPAGGGAAAWHRELVASASKLVNYTQSSPAIAWTGSSVVIAAPDNFDDLNYWWQRPADSGTWHPGQVAPGPAG